MSKDMGEINKKVDGVLKFFEYPTDGDFLVKQSYLMEIIRTLRRDITTCSRKIDYRIEENLSEEDVELLRLRIEADELALAELDTLIDDMYLDDKPAKKVGWWKK